MRAVLRYVGALAAAVGAHFGLLRLAPEAARFVDFFLVVLLHHALRSGPLGGMAYGLTAGLVADAVSGGPYGLYGLAGTVTGFGASVVSQLVVIQRSSGAFGLCAAGAALQQVVLVGVVLLTFPTPVLPAGVEIAVRTATTAVLGTVLFQLGRGLRRRFASWQQGRPSKIRWGR